MRTCVFCAFLTLAMSYAAAQDTEPQIWSGVFSTAQADRGRAVIAAHCTQCHGQNRSLSGELFMLHWEGHDLARLYRKIKDTMPPGRADSLSDADKLDALAYVLQQNGFPVGAQELSGEDAALQSIRVLPRGGPRPLPSGAVVQVIGCLAEGNNASWQVVNATEPTAATLQTKTADPGMADADTAANATFQLISVFPSPAPHAGQRVLVKGLLIRNPSGDRINVVSLVPVGPCAP